MGTFKVDRLIYKVAQLQLTLKKIITVKFVSFRVMNTVLSLGDEPYFCYFVIL